MNETQTTAGQAVKNEHTEQHGLDPASQEIPTESATTLPYGDYSESAVELRLESPSCWIDTHIINGVCFWYVFRYRRDSVFGGPQRCEYLGLNHTWHAILSDTGHGCGCRYDSYAAAYEAASSFIRAAGRLVTSSKSAAATRHKLLVSQHCASIAERQLIAAADSFVKEVRKLLRLQQQQLDMTQQG